MSVRNKTIVLLFAFLFFLSSEANGAEPFNRHYIIVVDQTIKSSNTNMGIVYKSLCNWLNGERTIESLNLEGSTIPEPIAFDIQHDAISLFAFGLPGDGFGMKSDYGRIHRECYSSSKSSEYIFDDIVGSLIKKRNRYFSGNLHTVNGGDNKAMSLTDFLSTDMRNLFNSTDPLHISISQESGITMSHFVYPLIMNFISKEETANEYYLILVSDFKSGLYSNNDEDDWKTLSAMTAGKSEIRKYFEKQINSMRAPFVQADYLHFQAGDIGAKGTRLIMKSLIQKSQVFLSSSLSLSQSSGNTFKVNSAKIAFDKDPLTTIDSIQIVLSENGNVLCRKTIARGDESIAELLRDNREYEIPSQKVDLGKESLDDVTIGYQLYTMSHDASGNSVLPVALLATQNISKDDISMINKELRKAMTIISIITLAIVAVVTLVLRGRKKYLNTQIGTFAQKYMNVTEKEGAVELPCWFYHDGENTKSIRVNGFLLKKGFSIGGDVKVFARLQDGKPEGFKYYIDRKNAVDFVEVKRNGDEISFNINIEMLPEKINPAELSTCKVKLDFMIETRFFGLFPRQDVVEDIDEIEFYFMNDLGTAWVGFDPGTTGSCISYGCTGGSLDNPNIRMVRSNDNEIIPSKLILNKNFGNSDIAQLRPGIDYWYGKKADENWKASNYKGEPCFQSIKKLLGYKNSADDMIEVKWGNDIRKLTGLQLAHLLVKGLKSELDDNISKLTSMDAMRFVGKNGRARRAVVAIPNNYTLPKITDMVNSVRMLNSFDEVRYIYEAEGILFNYFRKNYKSQKPGTETIMVYDMGGATINLSIFRVDYTEENGTIYYNVHTLGRIGYAVGGDNIDVAIMEHIFTLPQLTTSLTEKEQEQNHRLAEDLRKRRHDYQLAHKIDIIDAVRALKLDIVKAANGKNLESNILENFVSFEGFVKDSIIQKFASLPDDSFAKIPSERFAYEMIDRIKKSKSMNRYVVQNVEDAVREIMQYPEIESLSHIDTLVFAGRSTMFPGIRECVSDTLGEHFKKFKVYNRFNSDEIKTSVSYGACWYGIYNSLVTLDNSRLSCAYGFKITKGGRSELNVLLNQNDVFDEDGNVSYEEAITNHFDADGNVVDFYQVMGSGKGENLFSEENRHKVNFIGSIDVTTTTSEIGMSVDRRNVVTCAVTFDTGDTSSFKDLNVVGRDITKENDWAYVFAVTPQTRIEGVGGTVPLRPVQPASNSSTSRIIVNPERKPSGPSKRV